MNVRISLFCQDRELIIADTHMPVRHSHDQSLIDPCDSIAFIDHDEIIAKSMHFHEGHTRWGLCGGGKLCHAPPYMRGFHMNPDIVAI